MDSLLAHHGIDWIGMASTLIALWLLGNGRRAGFIYGMASNVAWAAFGISVASLPTVLANVVCLLLSLRGWLRWRQVAPAALALVGPTAAAPALLAPAASKREG
jgi:hypothetical protein